jgi:acetyl-CoA carboxylase carboxyltransferase component
MKTNSKTILMTITGAGTYYSDMYSVVSDQSISIEVVPSVTMSGAISIEETVTGAIWQAAELTTSGGSALTSGVLASGVTGLIFAYNDIATAGVRVKAELTAGSGTITTNFLSKN